MRLHKRTLLVQRARGEFTDLCTEFLRGHDLTWGEWTSILADQLTQQAMYQIRDERHPDDPERKGDEE